VGSGCFLALALWLFAVSVKKQQQIEFFLVVVFLENNSFNTFRCKILI
jgi:hypothetical protein